MGIFDPENNPNSDKLFFAFMSGVLLILGGFFVPAHIAIKIVLWALGSILAVGSLITAENER